MKKRYALLGACLGIASIMGAWIYTALYLFFNLSAIFSMQNVNENLYSIAFDAAVSEFAVLSAFAIIALIFNIATLTFACLQNKKYCKPISSVALILNLLIILYTFTSIIYRFSTSTVLILAIFLIMAISSCALYIINYSVEETNFQANCSFKNIYGIKIKKKD